MNNARRMVREVDPPRETIDCLNGPLSQRGQRLRSVIEVLSFVRLDDDGNDEVEVFLDISAERQERIKDLDLSANPLLCQFALVDLKYEGKNRGQEWLEFRVQCFSNGFDQ